MGQNEFHVLVDLLTLEMTSFTMRLKGLTAKILTFTAYQCYEIKAITL